MNKIIAENRVTFNGIAETLVDESAVMQRKYTDD